MKITKAIIESASRRRVPDQRLMIGDLLCRGLALVVNPTGMTWRFDYKPRGTDPATGKRFPTQSVTIGTPDSHSVDEARRAAGDMKGQAKTGTDIAGERRARIAASAEKRSRTLDRLAEEYAKALPKRPKLRGPGKLSAAHVAAELAHVKAAITDMKAGGKAVADVGAADLRTLLRVNAEQPGAARHRFGALSRFLDWCRDEGLIAVNPCGLIGKDRRPKAVPARQDYMKLESLAQLWKVAGEAEKFQTVHRDYLRFLIAMPCRRTEAAKLDWADIDFDGAEWLQRGSVTKNGDLHRLHLHPLALDILRARHEAAGRPKAGLVFPAPRSGKALTTFSTIKAVLAAKAENEGWRIHDFRRS
ncbi:tyrosine-type recombinase/integrase [Roseicella aerolata]|uniref:Integrase family protein n=1 Tax=Roseicella aerolata TaxID=2883479 RepID=A0A9X1IIK7_9PROT|nr:integrase family protein [Roseicella aerolata]